MKIQTFSVVVGSEACNARCPFCMSKMTVSHDLGLKEPEVDWRIIDLQSNGILLVEQQERYRPQLQAWYEKGLSLGPQVSW